MRIAAFPSAKRNIASYFGSGSMVSSDFPSLCVLSRFSKRKRPKKKRPFFFISVDTNLTDLRASSIYANLVVFFFLDEITHRNKKKSFSRKVLLSTVSISRSSANSDVSINLTFYKELDTNH